MSTHFDPTSTVSRQDSGRPTKTPGVTSSETAEKIKALAAQYLRQLPILFKGFNAPPCGLRTTHMEFSVAFASFLAKSDETDTETPIEERAIPFLKKYYGEARYAFLEIKYIKGIGGSLGEKLKEIAQIGPEDLPVITTPQAAETFLKTQGFTGKEPDFDEFKTFIKDALVTSTTDPNTTIALFKQLALNYFKVSYGVKIAIKPDTLNGRAFTKLHTECVAEQKKQQETKAKREAEREELARENASSHAMAFLNTFAFSKSSEHTAFKKELAAFMDTQESPPTQANFPSTLRAFLETTYGKDVIAFAKIDFSRITNPASCYSAAQTLKTVTRITDIADFLTKKGVNDVGLAAYMQGKLLVMGTTDNSVALANTYLASRYVTNGDEITSLRNFATFIRTHSLIPEVLINEFLAARNLTSLSPNLQISLQNYLKQHLPKIAEAQKDTKAFNCLAIDFLTEKYPFASTLLSKMIVPTTPIDIAELAHTCELETLDKTPVLKPKRKPVVAAKEPPKGLFASMFTGCSCPAPQLTRERVTQD